MGRRADVFVLVEKRTMYCVCCEIEREIVCIFLCLQPTESAACLADVFNISWMEYKQASHSSRILWKSGEEAFHFSWNGHMIQLSSQNWV